MLGAPAIMLGARSNSHDIFAEFFGFSSPFGGGGCGNGMRGGSFSGIFGDLEKEGP